MHYILKRDTPWWRKLSKRWRNNILLNNIKYVLVNHSGKQIITNISDYNTNITIVQHESELIFIEDGWYPKSSV